MGDERSRVLPEDGRLSAVKLDLRFIIPGRDAGTVLLRPDGGLPAVAADGDDDEAAIVAVDLVLRTDLAFRAPVLETHPRRAGIPDGDPIPTLVTTEPAPAGWTPPVGLEFGPIPDALGGIPEILVVRAAELLDELRTGSAPPALRPRWARPGWNARASGWMIAACAAAGRPLLDEPRPFFLRGISALLRGPTAGGDVFLKAVFPPFHAQPVITRFLFDRFPSAVPRVIAIEPDEGWLLVDDLAAPWVEGLPAEQKAAGLATGARAIVGIQRGITPADIEALVAAGSPRRPLADLADAFEAAVGPDGLAIVDKVVDARRRDRAVAATRTAVERVVDLGFPTTLVHGDFHAGNAALVDGRVVIIDWSDAAIGDPLVDLVTWLAEPGSAGGPAGRDRRVDRGVGRADRSVSRPRTAGRRPDRRSRLPDRQL